MFISGPGCRICGSVVIATVRNPISTPTSAKARPTPSTRIRRRAQEGEAEVGEGVKGYLAPQHICARWPPGYWRTAPDRRREYPSPASASADRPDAPQRKPAPSAPTARGAADLRGGRRAGAQPQSLRIYHVAGGRGGQGRDLLWG